MQAKRHDERWLQFTRDILARTEVTSPTAAAAMLTEYARHSGSPTDPEAIAALLGIPVKRRARGIDRGGAVLHRSPSPTLWDPPGSIEIGTYQPKGRRRQFSLAHELGHWTLDRLLESQHVSSEFRARWCEPGAQENFATEFAQYVMEPLLPHVAAEGLLDVEASLSAHMKALASVWMAEGAPALTIYHLLKLAEVARLSLRHTISRLRGGPLLAHAQTAILVYRQTANRYTLRDKGIRLWQRALPPWGYLPTNQRGWRHGLTTLSDIYLRATHFCTVFHTERAICVKEKRISAAGQVKYICATLSDIRCATTPIDVKAEGRFLVTMFSWRVPPDWQEVIANCGPMEEYPSENQLTCAPGAGVPPSFTAGLGQRQNGQSDVFRQ